MLKSFDLTEKDITLIQELKAATGAGSAREVMRRALEEYHKKNFTFNFPKWKHNTPNPLNKRKHSKWMNIHWSIYYTK